MPPLGIVEALDVIEHVGPRKNLIWELGACLLRVINRIFRDSGPPAVA